MIQLIQRILEIHRIEPAPGVHGARRIALLIGVSLAAAWGVMAAPAQANGLADVEAFRGWETMRVVLQEGNPHRLRRVSIDGEGAESLIVVNRRHARLEFYRWLPPAQQEREAVRDPARPNELPMAPELGRDELTLDQLPDDVLAHDVTGDGRPELIILASSPREVLLFEHRETEATDADDAEERDRPRWRQTERWSLLDGTLSGRDRLMHVREPAELPGAREADQGEATEAEAPRRPELLVSFEEGVQRLTLAPRARPQWIEPRAGEREAWWLLDLDGDGERDLVEFNPRSGRAVRWHRASHGRLLPPQLLHERRADMAVALPPLTLKNGAARGESPAEDGEESGDALVEPVALGAELLLLGGRESGQLRRYRFGHDEASPVGGQAALPLPGGGGAVWCGVRIAGEPAVVARDPQRPRLIAHVLGEDGWEPARTFPVISDVEALAAPAGQPGTLLLRASDAGELYVSRWQDGRFTYPRPERFDGRASEDEADQPETDEPSDANESGGTTNDEGDRALLALETVGRTTWWVQRVGDSLDLYTWPADRERPRRTRFEAIGENVNQVRWLGGERLIVLDQYARNPRLIERADGEAVSRQPAHIRRSDIEQYRLYEIAGEHRPARLHDGVLRWLDDELHAEDQIMLEGGQPLASFVPIEPGEPEADEAAESEPAATVDSAAPERGDVAGRAWALERGGGFVQRLAPDEAGILRMAERFELPGGRRLLRDPVLGLTLVTDDGIIRLAPGRSPSLELIETLDARAALPDVPGEPRIDRIFTTDVLGDGQPELVLSDDEAHRLSVLARRPAGDDAPAALEPIITWPVFEDRKYPYGGINPFGQSSRATEPRGLIGLDLGGDGHQDLAMLCHDRLVIYLAREASDAPAPEEARASPDVDTQAQEQSP